MSRKYGKIDPLNVVDAALANTSPVERCCCCCSPKVGIRCALRVFIFEAVWHIAISIARPLWEWTSTMTTITAFILQDICRVVLLVLCVAAWRGLNRGRDGAEHLRALLRGLLILVFLEMLEMFLKFFEVHAVCNAPVVLAAHRARAIKYNLTGFNLTTGADDGWCEMVSDIYDFGWGIFALLILLYVIRVVHSYLRLLDQPDGQAAMQASRATPAADAKPAGTSIVTEVV